MVIKLDLSEKLYISTGETMDSLEFKVLNNSIFITEHTGIVVSNYPELTIPISK